jgi:hypothetical protein
MDKIEPAIPDQAEENSAVDLARRLKLYRRRIEAEGRPRSVRLIDRAIEDADGKSTPQ